MQLAGYILRESGMSYQQVFGGPSPLVRLEADETGATRIVHWNEQALGIPQPSDQVVADTLAAPEYVDLPAYAAGVRYAKEIGGITVSGVPIATDDRSKQMIMGARIAADADANFTTSWVGGDGAIYPLTAPQIIGISDAVLAHVQSCFATYATVAAAIKAGDTTTTAQIDAAFAAI